MSGIADNQTQTSLEQLQQRLQKLKVVLDDQVPYRLESVFAETSGWGGNAEIKRRARLIKQASPKLSEMLLPNEEVLYVAKGTQFSLAESFMGSMTALVNQTIFALTNLRLLMLRCNSKCKPLETFWVLYYSEIANFKPNWNGVLDLKLADGKRMSFGGFSVTDRKAMPVVFHEAIDNYRRLGFHPEVTQSRENLCSHCYQVVPAGEFHCQNCGTDYWRPKELALRSLVFPSWGDFCMKHYEIAMMEFVGYALGWVHAITNLAGLDVTRGMLAALFIVLVVHPMDAMLTYSVASKGLNPKRGPDDDAEEVFPD